MILLHVFIVILIFNNKLMADASRIIFLHSVVGPQKARQFLSNVNSTRISSFDIQEAVHYELVPQGQIVNRHLTASSGK
jgi:hypothetical protein